MRFQELRFTSQTVQLRIANVLAMCKKIKEEGAQEIDSATMKELIGQGETGKILKQVFVKIKNGSSRGVCTHAATWIVNPRAYSDLIVSYKFFLGDKNDLEEIFFEQEKVRHDETEIKRKYRALAGK